MAVASRTGCRIPTLEAKERPENDKTITARITDLINFPLKKPKWRYLNPPIDPKKSQPAV
jgi:DNA modification methylase